MAFKELLNCRFCGQLLKKIFHLGDDFPLAGGFLKNKSEFLTEKFFPLTLMFCEACSTSQCKQVISSEILFQRDYSYYSSMIPMLVEHFQKFALELSKEFNPKETSILEMGCNDGVFLYPLSKLGFNVVGIDPSNTVKNIRGITVYNDFFNKESVDKILSNHSQFDIFLSSNSFAHIDNMREIFECVKRVVKPFGSIIIEVHDSRAIVDEMNFDFIYHEHMSYYTAVSFVKLCKLFGLSLVKVKHTKIHGGSIRVYIKNCENQSISMSERRYEKVETFLFLPQKVLSWKSEFLELMKITENTVVYGYGASARANILLKFCDINLNEIIDDAPSKIGTFTPFFHLEIKPSKIITEKPPNYILILAWPYANDIMSKITGFSGKFIIPLPTPRIL